MRVRVPPSAPYLSKNAPGANPGAFFLQSTIDFGFANQNNRFELLLRLVVGPANPTISRTSFNMIASRLNLLAVDPFFAVAIWGVILLAVMTSNFLLGHPAESVN